MKYLVWVLMIGVFVRHDSANWLSAQTGLNPRLIFYGMGGLWEAVLCGTIIFLLHKRKSFVNNLCMAVMVIGMVEALQLPLCHAFVLNSGVIPKGQDVCDFVTGLPVGATLLALEVFIVIYLLFFRYEKK